MQGDKQNTPLFGLVLAGGQSRRMGSDKALLRHDGRTQLAVAVELLTPVTGKQFVSTRPDQRDDPERSRYEQIVDRYENMGPVAGILSAMDAHPDADWLVVACDLPNLDSETLVYLKTHLDTSKPFTAYQSSHDGLPEPLCAIYRRGSDSIIRSFVDDGLVCPRKMLIRSDTRLLRQPNPASLDNVNTPEDLATSVLEASG
ncbi:MAG: molybdenum cofactor guanylyltransferase [Gammaproteobacteria bacterium]|nr:molybdenum cofactor guanylyltransferase [Gammaproteobacteria bacterium]